MNGDHSTRVPPVKRRIVLIDDQPLVRRGLADLIDHEPDLTVCATAATPQAGLEAVASCRPELVITYLPLDEGDGLVLVREVHARFGDVPVLVLTMHDAPHHARRALRAGARGFVHKQGSTEELLTAIRRVLDGETYVSS